ncbi:hypothetical protein ACMT9U_13240 [Clavibacter sp. Sh2036]|uniref:hypothetical protein n=1 Tax=Clavibacter sp. Sh2036 TaxID=3397677 RepID=UPI0039DF7F3C
MLIASPFSIATFRSDNVVSIIWSVVLAALGVAVLHALYATFRIKWPDAYSSLTDTFSLTIRATWLRFILYRFAPVFLVALGISVTADRQDAVALLAVGILATAHVASTNGRSFVRDMRGKKETGDFRPNFAAYHAGVIALVLAAAVAAYLLRKVAAPLVPGADALVESLWTAALVATCAGLLFSLIGTRDSRAMAMSGEYLSRRAIADVGISTVDYAYTKAVETGADPILIRSILFAEVLQRPRWVRNLENWSWWTRRRGTYGVMQTVSRKPVGDRESIDRTCLQFAGVWGASYSGTGEHASWDMDWRASWADLGYRNGDGAFIEMVHEIYRPSFYAYGSQAPSHTVSVGDIRLYQVRRHAISFGVRGMTSSKHVIIKYVLDGREVVVGSTRHGDGRVVWAWEFNIPPAAESVALLTFAENGVLRGGAECSLEISALEWELPFI